MVQFHAAYVYETSMRPKLLLYANGLTAGMLIFMNDGYLHRECCGGGWYYHIRHARATTRYRWSPDVFVDTLGYRLVSKT